MISSDQPSVEDSSSIIPLVNEEPQLNPPAISQDAAGQQVIQSTDERWDTMGEDLVQRELISTQVTPEMVAFMGELDSKCHQEVKKFINIRVEFGLEYPKFYPESLDEARGDPTCPPVPDDEYLNIWTLRVLSMQEQASHLPAAFSFYRMYNVTAENNLVAFRCVQIISQDHVVHGKKGLSGKLPTSVFSSPYQPDSQTACDNAALARVHPAAMGLISFYYRLEQAIVNYRRLMLRYEARNPRRDDKLVKEREVIVLLLQSMIAVITAVAKLVAMIRSGVLARKSAATHKFRDADLWRSEAFTKAIWNELAILFWLSPFGIAIQNDSSVTHPVLTWLESTTDNIARDRAQAVLR